MRIGIFSGRINDASLDHVVADAAEARDQGFASYWAPQIFGHDALTALAVVGREVPEIELGTSVVPTYPRHPLVLAQQALTVQAAIGGRLALGIGLSHKVVIESMLGLAFEKPVRHLREYLAVLLPLLRGEPVAFDGETLSTHAAISVPGTPPAPPVVLAALGPKMLELAGAVADGTLTWCVGLNTLRDFTVPTITAAAEQAGRPGPRVIAALPVCVTDDPAGARARAAGVFVIYGQLPSYRAMLDREGAAGPEDLVIAGGEDEVAEQLERLSEAGVTDFAAVEFSSEPSERERTRSMLRSLR